MQLSMSVVNSAIQLAQAHLEQINEEGEAEAFAVSAPPSGSQNVVHPQILNGHTSPTTMSR